MIPDLPSIFNVITVAPILSYLWIRFGPEIMCYLDKKETRKLFSSIMIIFIFFKMAIFNLSTESDVVFDFIHDAALFKLCVLEVYFSFLRQ